MIVCEDSVIDEQYQQNLRILLEVLSKSTRRTDEIEKLHVYQQIESLQAYILAEQSEPHVVV